MRKKLLTLVLAIGAVGASQADVVGHWSFDSDYTDVSGNGLDGTMVDVTTIGDSGITTTAGEFQFGGGALNLTSDKDYIALSSTQTMVTDADGYAFAFWAKNREVATQMGGMVVGDPNNTTDFFWIDDAFGGARWRSNASANTGDFATGAEDTAWHHWAVVVAGNDVSVYLDGSFHSTEAGEAGTDFNFAAIGDAYKSVVSSQTFEYNGQIDEVWLFDAAIDAATVSSLHTTNVIPEPATIGLFGLTGIIALAVRRLRVS